MGAIFFRFARVCDGNVYVCVYILWITEVSAFYQERSIFLFSALWSFSSVLFLFPSFLFLWRTRRFAIWCLTSGLVIWIVSIIAFRLPLSQHSICYLYSYCADSQLYCSKGIITMLSHPHKHIHTKAQFFLVLSTRYLFVCVCVWPFSSLKFVYRITSNKLSDPDSGYFCSLIHFSELPKWYLSRFSGSLMYCSRTFFFLYQNSYDHLFVVSKKKSKITSIKFSSGGNALNSNQTKVLLHYFQELFISIKLCRCQREPNENEKENEEKRAKEGEMMREILSHHWATTALLSFGQCLRMKQQKERKKRKWTFLWNLLVDCLLMQFYDWP